MLKVRLNTFARPCTPPVPVRVCVQEDAVRPQARALAGAPRAVGVCTPRSLTRVLCSWHSASSLKKRLGPAGPGGLHEIY